MKIGIDLGHGVSYDGGAVGIIKEETIINAVGSVVIRLLKQLGHTVIESRPGSASSTSDSLNRRVNTLNSNKVDLSLSIHANAGGGKGVEIYTYKGKEVNQARNIINKISALGFNNRGIKSQSLALVNNTTMTSMLLEICFTDTKSDVDLYNKIGAERIGQAIVEGLTGQTVNNSTNTTGSYLVKITGDVVNIRAGAGTNYKINGTVKRGEVFTIVETNGDWGKLKSGAGWICLNYTTRC